MRVNGVQSLSRVISAPWRGKAVTGGEAERQGENGKQRGGERARGSESFHDDLL
jgi:hypothetical protein